MKNGQWLMLALTAGVLLALGCVSQSLAATTIHGKSSTEVEWFDDPEGDTAIPISQYLQLNVTDIVDSGWAFRGYGRLADDPQDEVDVDSRLYYGYLEKRNLVKALDLRLGRQFITTAAGASLMDGVRFDYSDLGPLAVELFGGGDVTYYEGYDKGDIVFGGQLSSRKLVKNLKAALSYLQKREESDTSFELVGFEADYNVPGLINFYNETQYSLLTEEATYVLLGANYYRDPKWSLRAEYLYSLPVFSSTSIYSVFAVSEYQELMLEANINLAKGLRAFGRVTNEMYEEMANAQVLEAGIEQRRVDAWSYYVIGTLRSDEDGQDLRGIKAHVAYLFADKFEAGVGGHIDVYERELGFITEGTDGIHDDTTSKRLWVDGAVYLTDTVNVTAKVERIDSELWDEYYRGRVRLNILF